MKILNKIDTFMQKYKVPFLEALIALLEIRLENYFLALPFIIVAILNIVSINEKKAKHYKGGIDHENND